MAVLKKYKVVIKEKSTAGFRIHIGKSKYAPIPVKIKRQTLGVTGKQAAAGKGAVKKGDSYRIYAGGQYVMTISASSPSAALMFASGSSMVLLMIGKIYGTNVLAFVDPFVFQEYEWEGDQPSSKEYFFVPPAEALSNARRKAREKQAALEKALEQQEEDERTEVNRLVNLVYYAFFDTPDLMVRLWSVIYIKGPTYAGPIIFAAIKIKETLESAGVRDISRLFNPFSSSKNGQIGVIMNMYSIDGNMATYSVRLMDGTVVNGVSGRKGMRFGDVIVLTNSIIGGSLGAVDVAKVLGTGILT